MLRRRVLGAATVVVVLAAIAVGALRPNPFDHPLVVHAVFDDASGLAKVERQVRVAGVDVGTIGAVRRVGDDAEVELKLERDVGAVYADATAALRPHTAFEGSAFVDLDPGHPSAGPLRGAIPLRHTRVYVPLDQALRGLDATRRAALKDLAGQVAEAGGPATERATGDLLSTAPRLAADGAALARDLQGPRGTELSSSIASLSRVAARVAAPDRAHRLQDLLARVRGTLAGVNADDGGALDATLRALPPSLTDLQHYASAVTTISGRLRTLSGDARPAARAAAPVLRASRPVLAAAQPVLTRGGPLLASARGVLDELAGSTPSLGKVLATTGGAVDDLDARALPQLTATSRLGRPAYEQFLSAGAGLTGALSGYQTEGQSASAPGHYARISGDVVDGLLGNVLGPLCTQVPVCGLVPGAKAP